jgi:DNA invertase Pin-like site-specific DNA recombinase
MSNTYVAYLRVSTKKQGRSGLGLDAQQEIIKYNVGEDNIVAWFTEVHSGKNLDSLPELQKAKQLAKNDGHVLVIAKTDRLRNTQQALDLVDEMTPAGVFFCNVGRNADKFTLTLFFAFAEKERLEVSIRTKVALSRSGKLKGRANPLYGQKQTVTEKKQAESERIESIRLSKHGKVLLNPNLQESYKMAKYLRSDHKSYSEIAIILNKVGHKTSKGCSYGITQVKRLFEHFDGQDKPVIMSEKTEDERLIKAEEDIANEILLN